MVEFWRLSSARLCFAVVGIFLVMDAALLSRSNISIVIGKGALILLGVIAVCAFAIYVSWDDATKVAPGEEGSAKTKIARALHHYPTMAIALFLFSATATLASYLVVSPGTQFSDPLLVSLDEALGLDWFAVLAWANASPVLSTILCLSYASGGVQLFLVFGLLAATGRVQAAWDFFALFLLGGLLTVLIWALVPALAPYAHYNVQPSLYASLEAIIPNVGHSFVADLLALQNGTFRQFDLLSAEGLIAFPSFHTVMGLLFVYAVRDVRGVFWPMLVLNSLMIVATVPVGGHYFADVIGGGFVFAVSIVVVDWVNGRPPLWRRALARHAMTGSAAPSPA